MNYTESFEQFATRITTLDLALYAGVGLLLWVFFKDKISPVQQVVSDFVSKVKIGQSTISPNTSVNIPEIKNKKEDVFFKLIASWKQTRDLAVQSECEEAVKSLDQTFPYLSPNVCGSKVIPQQNKV